MENIYLRGNRKLRIYSAEERNHQNYEFLKDLYWDLILYFKKTGDQKSVSQLKQSWAEVDILFKS